MRFVYKGELLHAGEFFRVHPGDAIALKDVLVAGEYHESRTFVVTRVSWTVAFAEPTCVVELDDVPGSRFYVERTA